ncbi:Sister chromatid cohesion protein DCC1 [Paramicrosporidium saccamoebae]|uniref:Sister chromatid cohesion protein DCC1 n=1 Tax=Paramicrosporidium saccamoebae TaxID=1246581 RepID=A0A2H9TQU5_9FUNG|nr:Sister chromatid cohesion protein DCC1 [Paramicrosporidium saccamoebae]
MATSFLEAKRIPGKLVKLKDWLEACPYDGPDEEPQPEALARLRVGGLFGDVQASDCEIRNFLSDSGAILINGCYRLVSAGHLCRFFKMLFALLTMNDLCSCSVLEKCTIMTLFASDSEGEEFPPNVVEHLLSVYMDSTSRLDQRRIGRFFAEELLKARPIWLESEFLSAWRQLLGDLEPSISYLGDLILKEPVPGMTETRLAYFPASRLPLEPEARFARLFEVRPRWELTEIEPFVEGAARALEVELLDLLVKHARISTTPNGIKIVTALLSV